MTPRENASGLSDSSRSVAIKPCGLDSCPRVEVGGRVVRVFLCFAGGTWRGPAAHGQPIPGTLPCLAVPGPPYFRMFPALYVDHPARASSSSRPAARQGVLPGRPGFSVSRPHTICCVVGLVSLHDPFGGHAARGGWRREGREIKKMCKTVN